MSTAEMPGLIIVGYALSLAGGLAAVAVNELFMPAEIAETSPGMVAFGDMILFVLAAGVLGLAPTWFLLKLAVAKKTDLIADMPVRRESAKLDIQKRL
jgi:hypothetical protein